MFARRFIPIWLLVAWLCLDAAALLVLVAFPASNRSEWLWLAVHAQFMVASGWLIVGEHGRKTYAFVLALAVLVFYCIATWELSLSDRIPAALWLGGYLLGANVPLLIARLCGCQFRLIEQTETAEPPPHGPRFYQFSLQHLLLLMLAATLLGVAWHYTSLAPPLPRNQWLAGLGRILTVIFLSLFLLPWLSWGLTALFRPLQAWLIGTMTFASLGLIVARYVEAGGSAYFSFALAYLLWACVFFVHITLLQAAGYRWIAVRPKWLSPRASETAIPTD